MTPAVIAALCAGVPSTIGAITALVVACRGNGKARMAVRAASSAHLRMTAAGIPRTPPPDPGK